jgi:hypothetical protein
MSYTCSDWEKQTKWVWASPFFNRVFSQQICRVKGITICTHMIYNSISSDCFLMHLINLNLFLVVVDSSPYLSYIFTVLFWYILYIVISSSLFYVIFPVVAYHTCCDVDSCEYLRATIVVFSFTVIS